MHAATGLIQQLVDARTYRTADEVWERFADYLRNRIPARPAAKIGAFHEARWAVLMDVVQQFLDERPSRLLDPDRDDIDSSLFREFNQKPGSARPKVPIRCCGDARSPRNGHF